MPKPKPIYLAGEFVTTQDTYEVHSPYDESVVATVCRAGESEIEAALAAATAVFGTTKKLEPYERAEILHAIVAGLRESKAELAQLMAAEGGKPLTLGQGEVERAISTFTDAAEEVLRPEAEYLDLARAQHLRGRRGLVRRFPVGVVYGIAPFNFPLNLVAHKIAPAIACGCPIVLKPSSQTPLTALKLAEIINTTNLPKGAVSILPMDRKIGDKLNHDDRVKVISFTGSPVVGWKINESAGKKKIVLELGGNAAAVVAPSADLDRAADRISIAAFAGAGQSCISAQRIFVHESVYEELKTKLVKKTAALVCGDPADEKTTVGPLIDAKNAERVEEWLKQAVDQGATLLTGGQREGNIIKPALLENAPETCNVVKEEVFAPVAVLAKYQDLDEVITDANASRFGLQAGIFSTDFNEINHFYREVEAGGIVANDVPTFRADSQPYGGVKDSGVGREGVKYAIRDMTEERVLIWEEQ